MKRTFALVFLSLTFICVPLAQAGEQIWGLGNQGVTLRDWEIISGDWKFKGGWWEVTSRGDTPGIAVIKERVAKQLGLFTQDGMTCEITFEVAGDPGESQNQFIIFAYAPESYKDRVFQAGLRLGETIDFQGNRNGWSIERMHIRAEDDLGNPQYFDTEKIEKIKSNQEYHFKLEIQGNTIITSHNAKEQVRFTFGQDRPKNLGGAGWAVAQRLLALIRELPVGRIGLANEDAHTRFQSFKISGPNVLSVEPAGKLALIWSRIKTQ